LPARVAREQRSCLARPRFWTNVAYAASTMFGRCSPFGYIQVIAILRGQA
jgi:hypothetical protein